MAVCSNCSAENPDASLYCQVCGSRLGDWQPAEAPGRRATPPTGLKQPPELGPSDCPRCGHSNPPHMRFCNNCGLRLLEPEAPAAAKKQPKAEPKQGAKPAAKSAAKEPPICWRCKEAGDSGAAFCKFCGARYADSPEPSVVLSESIVKEGAEPPAAKQAAAQSAGAQPAAAQSAADSPEQAAAPKRPRETRPQGAATQGPGLTTYGYLVSIMKDGTDGDRYPIREESIDIGRVEGAVVLQDDPYLDERHARIAIRGGTAFVRDLGSVNGVYMRVKEPTELAEGDMFLLGQQVLRFSLLSDAEKPLGPAIQNGVMIFGTPEVARIARLIQYTTEGVARDVHYLYRDETVIGREQGDIVFTDDPFMSRRHAAIAIDRSKRRFLLRDLGSSNGTALRYRGERSLQPGDQFRIGRHLFRFERAK